MFDVTKEDLRDILRRVDEGRLQLPDFQRDYVWGEDDVKSLIASVAKGFPVGALLTLESGGAVKFSPRLLEGVAAKDIAPDELLLDGQQRMTSLFQSAFGQRPVRTRTVKGVEVERFYYIDIRRALASGEDIEDAIIGVPADRVLRTNFGRDIVLDLSSAELEYQRHYFPLNRVFDPKNWFYGWNDYWKEQGQDVRDTERAFDAAVVDPFQRYKMPIIRLDRSNSREAICLVFEKVNVGGKKLDAFELVTAIYAADDFKLRDDWLGKPGKPQEGRRGRIQGAGGRQDVFRELASTDFLQSCTVVHTLAIRESKRQEGFEGNALPQVSCRRDALLALPLESYKEWADRIELGFVESGKFLNEQKIMWHKDVPYPSQSVALAAVMALLGKEAETAAAKDKLEHWFWSVVFGELYGSSAESLIARDVPELVGWIRGGQPPRSVGDAIFQMARFRSLRSRLSSAYKGLHALLMRQGCCDFITGRPTDIMTYFNDSMDIHHVFPQAWCKTKGIQPAVFNSIVNKTPLSRRSNILISGDAPSVYLRRIEQQQELSPDALDALLRTHLIEPEYLRRDDFDGFFSARMNALGGLVAGAMRKTVVPEGDLNEPEYDTAANQDDDMEDAA